MFGILISNTHSLKCNIIAYDAVKCYWRRVQHKLLDAQVVVNAQFEDRTCARICPGDSLKRAGLCIHQMKTKISTPRRATNLRERPVIREAFSIIISRSSGSGRSSSSSSSHSSM